jgi:hypothetical protein
MQPDAPPGCKGSARLPRTGRMPTWRCPSGRSGTSSGAGTSPWFRPRTGSRPWNWASTPSGDLSWWIAQKMRHPTLYIYNHKINLESLAKMSFLSVVCCATYNNRTKLFPPCNLSAIRQLYSFVQPQSKYLLLLFLKLHIHNWVTEVAIFSIPPI